MKFALNLPPFADLGTPQALAVLAHQAEQAGWDGFFLWDHMIFDPSFHPIADPWVSLAAMAASTESIRLGTMVTPLARRRPWKVARETVSIDQLSGGRMILGIGLGESAKWDFGLFGENGDPRFRAGKLDESLDILTGLWSGEPFSFEGTHFQLDKMIFLPKPVQQPRIPIWCGGYWPRKAPFRRAARWDGIFPGGLDGELTPDDWRQIMMFIFSQRTAEKQFDAVHSGFLPSDPQQVQDKVGAYAEAGVTWWVVPLDPWSSTGDWSLPWTSEDTDSIIQAVRQGPPNAI